MANLWRDGFAWQRMFFEEKKIKFSKLLLNCCEIFFYSMTLNKSDLRSRLIEESRTSCMLLKASK